MSRDALPCIVCGQALQNVIDDAQNQPNDGLAFTTNGHYGSTVFDPMDGTAIEINVCDDCIRVAGREGRVLWSRQHKPVLCMGMVVGREEIYGPLVEWNPDQRPSEQPDIQELHVEIEEIGTDLGNVVWRPQVEETKRLLLRARALEEKE